MKKSNRNDSYDLLRIVSCIAVIICHVNYLYFDKIVFTPSNSYLWIVESLINIIVRFCVPCFVMLSGAMLLGNKENRDFVTFYKKRLTKILIPTLIIGLLIYIYSIVITKDIIGYSRQILVGSFYNYWYIYMTFGLYILTPFIIRLKETLTNKQYIIATFTLLVWAIESQISTSYDLPYSIGVVFAFLSYFMFGNVICENKEKIKLNKLSLIIIALCCIAITFVWRYLGHNNSKLVVDAYTNFFSPTIAIYSICIFTLFTKIKVNNKFYSISKYTLYIYLLHTFVYSSLFSIIEKLNLDNLLKTFILAAITIFVSFVGSIVYKKLSELVFKKKDK